MTKGKEVPNLTPVACSSALGGTWPLDDPSVSLFGVHKLM